MGWCSGATRVFDDIGNVVLNSKLSEEDQELVMSTLAEALEDEDWDCQQDSGHWDHPIVQKIMKELHPNWDWDEEELD